MSSAFALAANVPRIISMENGATRLSASGPIRVPTPSGWFVSRVPMRIAYVRDHDVVLGADWFAGTRSEPGTLSVRDAIPGLPLQDGYEWIPSPFANRSKWCLS